MWLFPGPNCLPLFSELPCEFSRNSLPYTARHSSCSVRDSQDLQCSGEALECLPSWGPLSITPTGGLSLPTFWPSPSPPAVLPSGLSLPKPGPGEPSAVLQPGIEGQWMLKVMESWKQRILSSRIEESWLSVVQAPAILTV